MQQINVLALVVVTFVVVALLGGPLLLIGFGVRANRHGLVRGRIMLGFGAVLFLLVLIPLAYHLYFGGPWHTRIVTQGTSPSGQEYCVVQTFQDLVEPYQISFYIRDTNRVWRWNYLDHEGYAWRTASVAFSATQAMVFCNDELFQNIPMPTGSVDIAAVSKGYAHFYCPAEFAVEDVFEFQKRKTR